MPSHEPSTAPLARVLFAPQSQFRGLYRHLLARLSGQGSAICVIAPRQRDAEYWRQATAELAGVEVVVNDRRYRVVREPVADEAALMARARRFEQDHGLDFNRLRVSDRHFGRGFAPGGFGHPRSRMSEESTYPQIVNALAGEIDFWIDLFERFKPTIVINGNQIAEILAERGGVAFRVLATSRYQNLHQWADTTTYRNPRIRRAFDALSADLPAVVLDRPYDANLQYVARFGRNHTVARTLHKSAMLTMRQVYWRLRGYEKGKSYYLTENLRYLWRVRRDALAQSGRGTTTLKDLAGQKFVFFPLHTEPETALQGLSPDYLFQLEAIIRLARDLPVDTCLAVKDTQPAVGRRPRDFYAQILELKNVRMLDMKERGVDVVKAASAVATITGTAGFEAAIIGKPVITFGHHAFYNFLPHVWLADASGDLRGILRTALDPQFDSAAAVRSGARFLEAVKRVSFDLGAFDFTRPEACAPEIGASALQALRQSLDNGSPGVAA